MTFSATGVITPDSTGSYCHGDEVSVTCTITGTELTWDVPGTTRDIGIDSGSMLPLQLDQYTVTFIAVNSSSVTSTISFPAVEGASIGCLPRGLATMREEFSIQLASNIQYQYQYYVHLSSTLCV